MNPSVTELEALDEPIDIAKTDNRVRNLLIGAVAAKILSTRHVNLISDVNASSGVSSGKGNAYSTYRQDIGAMQLIVQPGDPDECRDLRGTVLTYQQWLSSQWRETPFHFFCQCIWSASTDRLPIRQAPLTPNGVTQHRLEAWTQDKLGISLRQAKGLA